MLDAALVTNEPESFVDKQTRNRAVGHDESFFRVRRTAPSGIHVGVSKVSLGGRLLASQDDDGIGIRGWHDDPQNGCQMPMPLDALHTREVALLAAIPERGTFEERAERFDRSAVPEAWARVLEDYVRLFDDPACRIEAPRRAVCGYGEGLPFDGRMLISASQVVSFGQQR